MSAEAGKVSGSNPVTVRDIHSVTLCYTPYAFLTKLGLCLSFFGSTSFINSYLYEFITHYV